MLDVRRTPPLRSAVRVACPPVRGHKVSAILDRMHRTEDPRRVVLVADDEPYIGRIIQLKLEAGPYRVELALDGRAAMERLRSRAPYDLVLLDIMMPHLNGLDVLQRMRELPHRAETPVIVLTAKGQAADRERAQRYGATDFMTKPFSPKKLLARIDQLFED